MRPSISSVQSMIAVFSLFFFLKKLVGNRILGFIVLKKEEKRTIFTSVFVPDNHSPQLLN